MKAEDLDLQQILEVDPTYGTIRFAGQRALILDALALGLLRVELIKTLGLTAARGVLTRLGYSHGRRTAEALKTALPWDTEEEWRRSGWWLNRLRGLAEVEPAFRPVFRELDDPRPLREAIWRNSYEAEQHLLHLGRTEMPVCWSLCGFASGYVSYTFGQPIYFFEDRCMGKGDARCTVVARPRAKWGAERAADIAYYETDCLDEHLRQLTEAVKQAERRLRIHQPRAKTEATWSEHPGIVARSDAMRRALDLARRVAAVDSTVVITGESGVGKEVVARFIHQESARASGPFIAINCGAVPEGLLESELFGHVRGAFTGATDDRAGLFEAARGGTLLLDEVGDVPPAMQVKLLRVLQEREVRRVGENKTRPIDVRVIAATHRDLLAESAAGRFRQDLYYRLRVVEVMVPPLRERRDDILPLARAFLVEAAARLRRKVSGFTSSVADHILSHSWPGNVRELQNAIEHAVVLAQGPRIDLDDLPRDPRVDGLAFHVGGEIRPLAEIERSYVLAALAASNGNKAQAAARLGIGTATLFRKLKSYGGESVARGAGGTA